MNHLCKAGKKRLEKKHCFYNFSGRMQVAKQVQPCKKNEKIHATELPVSRSKMQLVPLDVCFSTAMPLSKALELSHNLFNWSIAGTFAQ